MSKIGAKIIDEMERTGKTVEEIQEEGFENEDGEY